MVLSVQSASLIKAMHGMACGGFGNANTVNEDVNFIAKEVKSQVEARTGTTYSTYEPITYKSQAVAGTNYFIKVRVDYDQYIHIKVLKPLPWQGTELSLEGVLAGMSLESAL